MVFESIVVEILNKFLGDYVQNLDSSQLKIGIWGGDVALKNLSLKPSALDELNLPIRVVYGHLGTLILKIPWKNIYTAPVQVSIENLFLLVNPIQDIVYDKEKEEKLKQEIKQKAINKVELAKKAEREKESAEVDDSFVEKLTAQIVKNVQVFIHKIHLRYEDRITKPEHPFSIGVSLHTLELHTTNETCDRYILPQQESPIFYKKMSLEGLSVYWNINTKLFTDRELVEEEILNYFLEGISQKNQIVRDYMYIVGPISSEAKLQINSKPNLMNFMTPKMYLSLLLEELLMNLSRSQYQDFVAVLETFDRMSKSAQYRKYRPSVKQYKGHYKLWWKFAINSVLEEQVKKSFGNWNWNSIYKHRKLCKDYQRVYRNKLTQKPNQQIMNALTELELYLDAFNIVLLRQKVENEVEREGRLIADQKSKKKGWFGGWFSSANEAYQPDEKDDLASQFEKVMTDEEKQKLYKAIDYHESASPEYYPVGFVATRLEFILRTLKIFIRDDHEKCEVVVLQVELNDLLVTVQQRPTAQSLSVSVQLHSLKILGLSQNNVVPKLVKSMLPPDSEKRKIFLNVLYETNPEDGNFDQRLHMSLKPLKVVYDAQTVIRILDVFTPEKDITSVTDQIQVVANSTLEEMKEKSATNLQYAIEKSVRFDLQIDIMAPYLIIPCGGFYTKNELSLVVNLGRISIHSKMRAETSDIRKLLAAGKSKDQVLSEVITQCYDQFSVCLSDIQVLALRPGEKWNPVVDDLHRTIDGHILEPTCFYIDVYRCVVNDDPRLPNMKVNCNLPEVSLRITERRLVEILSLLVSLPLPRQTTVAEADLFAVKEDAVGIYDSTVSLRHKLASINSTLRKYQPGSSTDTKKGDETDDVASQSVVDFSNIETHFTWKRLTICIQRDNSDAALIEAFVSDLELELIQRTYSTQISAKLGNIKSTLSYENSVVPAISSPPPENDGEQYLFYCKLLMAEKDSPVFENTFNSTAISIEIDFTKLYLIAHLEATLYIIQWVNNVKNHVLNVLASCQARQPQEVQPIATRPRTTSVSSSVSMTGDVHRQKKRKPKSALEAIIEDKLSKPKDGSSANDDQRTSKFYSGEGKMRYSDVFLVWGRVEDERIGISHLSDHKIVKNTIECVELLLIIRLKAIRVCLQTVRRTVASLDVDGFTASMTLRKSNTRVELMLSSVTVGDLNPETLYNKVVYIAEGNDALKIKMCFHNNDGTETSKDFDTLIQVEMSSLQCVFINAFLMDVLDFVNNFQSSKELFMGASAAAVTSCAQSVQQVYQTSAKIFLNIFMKAPVIFLPSNNRNDEIFVIDFGDLSVKNALKELPFDSAGHVPLIDEISVNLNDVKITRTNYERTAPEFSILKPVSCTLIVKRNLSASWFTKIPSFDVNGTFDPIYITIRNSDYALLSRMLDENIKSEDQSQSTRSQAVNTPVGRGATGNSGRIIESEVVVECNEACPSLSVPSSITTLLKFFVAVKSVEINLFSGVTQDCQNIGLAKFTLRSLLVHACVLTNNDMSVRAQLSDCCIDDTRPSKINNQVRRYMTRKSSAADASDSPEGIEDAVDQIEGQHFVDECVRSMIDFRFEKRNIDKTYVDVRVSSFILILNLDHLTKIQEFFTPPESKLTKCSAAVERSKRVRNPSRLNAGTAIMEDERRDSNPMMVNCNVIIEKPDIILVENLDDIDTNAVMMNSEANLRIQMSDGGRMDLCGVLQNLQLYTCCYNPSKRKQTTSLILYPVTVNLSGHKTNAANLQVDTSVTKIKIIITSGTIELLATIFSSVMPNSESETNESEVNDKDCSTIWQEKPLLQDYWFLQIEEGIDVAASDTAVHSPRSVEKRKDVFVVSAPSINIILEAGNVEKTIPLLSLQSSIRGIATITTNTMLFDSSVSLEMAYYNSRLALWEPIIEPMLQSLPHSPESVYEPWKMQFLAQKVNKLEEDLDSEIDNAENDTVCCQRISHREVADMSLTINSKERMEITVTKTGVDVIKTIAQSFNRAAGVKTCSNLSALNNPNYSFYSLVNRLGIDVVLNLQASDSFKVLRGNLDETATSDCSAYQSLTLKTGDMINLVTKKESTDDANETTARCEEILMVNLNAVKENHFLRIYVPDKNKNLSLPFSRADKRFFSLKTTPRTGEPSTIESWGLVSEVEIIDGGFVLTLRSVVQVHNFLDVDIGVFYVNSKSEYISLGTVSPSKHLDLPVQAVYSPNSRLYFAPYNYTISSQPFVWKDLQRRVSMSTQVQCVPKNIDDKDPFFIRIVGEMEQVAHENTNSFTLASAVYNINLRPTFVFKNYLPLDLECQAQGTTLKYHVGAGLRISMPTIEPDHSTLMVKLKNYLGLTWRCKRFIESDAPVFSVWTFSAEDESNDNVRTLNLGVWFSSYGDSIIFAIYCPFWMVNKTGLNLYYKAHDDDTQIVSHPKGYNKPILFSCKEKSFFGKKKACVKVEIDGEWSEKLSIDAAGSSGSVNCHSKNRVYQLGVHVALNSNTLTRQVVFSPFFSFANNCQFSIEFREKKPQNTLVAAEWHEVSPETCVPFWPTVQDDKNRILELRISGTSEVTTPFSYFTFKTYPLALMNKYGGLLAEVQVTEGSVYIAVSPFQPKLAPALIINDTECSVQLDEVDLNLKSLENAKECEQAAARCLQNNDILQSWRLHPKTELLFNWSNNYSKAPVLLINRNISPIDLRKDGVGECTGHSRSSGEQYWISFLNGMQRTVLITCNKDVLKEIEAVGDFEHIQTEMNFSLDGIGLSVVNDLTRNELMYFCICSSGVVWETQKKSGKRFSPVSDESNVKLEEAYSKYCLKLKTSDGEDVDPIVQINLTKEKILVDFNRGLILGPRSANLRRTYHSGIWTQIRSSERYRQVHAKVHRLQIDNQTYDCVFPVVFFPIPPPKSVVTDELMNEGLMKPFAELSIVQRVNGESHIRQFKYFKLLIQEFHVRVDIGFLNGFVNFCEVDNISEEQELTQFRADEEVVLQTLCHHVTTVTHQDFYDLMHFSPLKMHLSFSLAGENPTAGTPHQGLPILNLVTQSIGVTLTDFNDVVFRLAYFERKHKFYSLPQLTTEMKQHYMGQFVKQLYVLVLGLDVLGNPFGLVTGLKQGVEDFFYEPFQGFIQGPSEFAEGVVLGVRSLFGHTVGGAAGAVGRITGVMGKGIAALTLDEEYQKRRRERLAQNQQSMTEGGRELVMGVVEGIEGVISKPLSGAREEGVKGFVKGAGKGVVGLFMRPASGVVDFASGTVDTVRRVATCSEEVRRYRLPRLMKQNGQVVPYSLQDAKGYKYLLDVEKGKFTKTDIYLFHINMGPVSHPSTEVLLYTDKRMLYIVRGCEVFADNTKVEWQYTWNEIREHDGVGETEDGIYIRIDANETRRFGSKLGNIFKKNDRGKALKIPDEELRRWLLRKTREFVQKAHRHTS